VQLSAGDSGPARQNFDKCYGLDDKLKAKFQPLASEIKPKKE
jgi:hypothetical protein